MRKLAAAFLVILLASPATADQPDLKPWFGTFSGQAVAKARDSVYFGIGLRGSEITIAPTGDGFAISWTTVKKSSGRSKTAKLTFAPAAREGVYRAAESGEPADGKPYIWATVRGKQMVMYILALNDKGGYDLSIYRRTLTDAGMTVRFRRLRDGAPVRIVSGKLTRKK